jgi:NTE family protein
VLRTRECLPLLIQHRARARGLGIPDGQLPIKGAKTTRRLQVESGLSGALLQAPKGHSRFRVKPVRGRKIDKERVILPCHLRKLHNLFLINDANGGSLHTIEIEGWNSAMAEHKKRIALALGSGSARGMAHIGVIQRLAERGIEPDIVCGTSAGALVAAVHACGKLDHFADWVSGLTNSDILHYMDIRLLASGGVAQGGRLIDFFKKNYGNPNIEDLPLRFTAVATDLYRGRETWLQEGPIWDAVRASIAIPGILVPVAQGNHWLVDGGLVNPVPVSVGRALGAEIIIAVNLNSDLLKPPKKITAVKEDEPEPQPPPGDESEEDEFSMLSRLGQSIKGAASNLWSSGDKVQAPGALNVMLSAINVMQDRITRSRMAGEPADVTLSPRLANVGFLEFSRASDAIAEGRAVVDRLWPEIEYALQLADDDHQQPPTPEEPEAQQPLDTSKMVSATMQKVRSTPRDADNPSDKTS